MSPAHRPAARVTDRSAGFTAVLSRYGRSHYAIPGRRLSPLTAWRLLSALLALLCLPAESRPRRRGPGFLCFPSLSPGPTVGAEQTEVCPSDPCMRHPLPVTPKMQLLTPPPALSSSSVSNASSGAAPETPSSGPQASPRSAQTCSRSFQRVGQLIQCPLNCEL